ncbi:transposase domain-containing protein [Amycolatopsis sp.]|uniref:transposase domain-containing protein n=1 Tax=Amycolatopsis sp. TaxID=37632 RepID=UPI00345A05E8
MVTQMFPPELVDAAVVGTGVMEQRDRNLPSRLMVYWDRPGMSERAGPADGYFGSSHTSGEGKTW